MLPYDIFLIFWLLISICIAVWVWQDLADRSPSLRLMKPAWILICLYTGLFGLLAYELTCRRTKPSIASHRRFRVSSRRQAVASTVHIVVGAATGIILAASIAAIFSLPTIPEIILEYLFAFAFAIFFIQLTYHRPLYDSYSHAFRSIFAAEWISLNFTLAAMFPVLSLCFELLPQADHPTLLRFWFVMQLAAVAGFLAGFPMIYWLIEHKLKPTTLQHHKLHTSSDNCPTRVAPPHAPSIIPYAKQQDRPEQSPRINKPSLLAIHIRHYYARLVTSALLSCLLLAAGLTIALYLTPILPTIEFTFTSQ
ncbi:DUF4396 domain-containing protein [Poriferisphaera sp. WC338]|uniref:DUF4396 domain-containing protein n=1 Tax=Poriferisphaera sp. WC338 TaxID=3425129 RepID=UPI003D816923